MGTLGKVLLGAVPVIAVLVAAAFVVPPEFPMLWRQVLLCLWALAGIAVAERVLFGPGVGRIARAMGLATARWPAVLVALLASLPMWLFLPIYGAAAGTPVTVRADWVAVLVGVILVNGVAEEVIHRAFVFGHLRAERSFWAAVAIGALVFGAQHLYLMATIGPVAGLASVVLAVLLVAPLSLLYERGGNSIVGPAILHTSSNAPIMLFVSGDATGVLLPHMAVVLASMYLSFPLLAMLERRRG